MSLEQILECDNVKHEKVAILNDIHTPFEDKHALGAVMNGIKYMKPNKVILLGDIVDFYSISRFDKNPERELHLKEEIETNYDMLQTFMKYVPKDCEVTYVPGNHENRLDNYIVKRAPELHWVPGLKWFEILKLKKLGIKHIDKRWMEYRGVMFSHLNKSNKYGGYTAKNLGTDFNRPIVHSHSHKEGHVRHGNLEFHDNGCLCDLNPEYMSEAGPSVWNHSFMVIDYIGDTHYMTQIPITNGKFIYDGRVFSSDSIGLIKPK